MKKGIENIVYYEQLIRLFSLEIATPAKGGLAKSTLI